MLAAPGFEDVPSLLHLLASCPSFQSGLCRMASVVTVLNPGSLMLDAEAQLPLPGLLEQLSQGYVDAVVLSDGPGVSAAQLAAAEQLLRLRNPDVPMTLLSQLLLAAEAEAEAAEAGAAGPCQGQRDAARAGGKGGSSQQKRSQRSGSSGRNYRRKSNGDGKPVLGLSAAGSGEVAVEEAAAASASTLPSGMLDTLLPPADTQHSRLATEQLARRWANCLPGQARVAAGHGQVQSVLVQLEGELQPDSLLQLVELLASGRSNSSSSSGTAGASSHGHGTAGLSRAYNSSTNGQGHGSTNGPASAGAFSMLLAGLIKVPAAEGQRLLQRQALYSDRPPAAAAPFQRLCSGTEDLLLSLSACCSARHPLLLPCNEMLTLPVAGNAPDLLLGNAPLAEHSGAVPMDADVGSDTSAASFLSTASGSVTGHGAAEAVERSSGSSSSQPCPPATVAQFVLAGSQLDVPLLQQQLSTCCTGRVLLTLC